MQNTAKRLEDFKISISFPVEEIFFLFVFFFYMVLFVFFYLVLFVFYLFFFLLLSFKIGKISKESQ